MSRIRLTQRMAAKNRKADKAVPESSIDLGKNRTYHEMDEYYTYDIECEAPNNNHGWKKNPRESTGHGIPKDARVYMAAKKATKLAMMLLGTNASDAVIESQARAFMRMGDSALTASIDRWAGCNGDCCNKGEEACGVAEEAAEVEAGRKKKTEEAPVEEETKPEAAPAPDGEGEAAPAPAPDGEAAPAPEADIDMPEEIKDEGEVTFDDDEEPKEEPKEESKKETDDANEMAMLASIFADDDAEQDKPAPASTVASRKEGVKRLCGQPTLTRVASVKSDDLTSLWDKWSNPTVIR